MQEDRIKQAAQYLLQQERERQRFGPIPEEFAPRTMDEGYAVQEALAGLLADTKGPVVGYKIALTSRVVQEMVGMSEPAAGVVFANTAHQSPASVDRDGYMHLAIECEIAARLGTDLPPDGAPYDRSSVGNAVEFVATAFELTDDRYGDVSQAKEDKWTGLAANLFNAGMVLGSEVKDWQSVDLGAVRGRVTINGELVGEGRGSDVLGHPFEALAWLANTLAKRGTGIRSGMTVITGSMVTPKSLDAGDSAVFVVDQLGEVVLDVS